MAHLRHRSPLGSVKCAPLENMSAVTTSMAGAVAISQLLLDLHERANALGYRELQRYALTRIASLVPFDSALFGAGTIQDGVPHGHDVILHEKPWSFMEDWEPIKHEDVVAIYALTHPGITGNFVIDGPEFDGSQRARVHCKKWGIEHVLCTSIIQQTAGLYGVLSVYRADATHPFTEEERQAIEIVTPHVFAAARHARVNQLRASSRVEDVRGQCAAIVNDVGLVLEAEPSLVALLRLEWPKWSGPHLPPEIVEALKTSRPSARLVRERIVVRTDASSEGVNLLHVRRTVLADRLTPREREIADAFSQGETYREIGARLGIAPNTVRRHLGNIYEKLGISSKVELDRMLADQ